MLKKQGAQIAILEDAVKDLKLRLDTINFKELYKADFAACIPKEFEPNKTSSPPTT